MKACFVCDDSQTVSTVYAPDTIKLLKETVGLSEQVYTKNDIENDPQAFADTQFIFSTWGMPCFTEAEIDRLLPKLKVIFYGAGTVRYFAEPFLNKGVKVISAWLANAVPVAEYATAQIILANKGFYLSTRMYTSMQQRRPATRFVNTYPGTFGTNVGLLGVGAIGSLVAKMLKNHHVHVYAYDPYLSDEKADALGIRKASLAYIFENCQTISNHIANLPETVGMLNYDLFRRMKENATFINTGRGAQVVEADLIRAMKEAPCRTAVLDVTDPEPPEEGSELYTMNNVFLTPHIAGSLGAECFRMGEYVAEEAVRYTNGEPLRYEVTHKMLETMA